MIILISSRTNVSANICLCYRNTDVEIQTHAVNMRETCFVFKSLNLNRNFHYRHIKTPTSYGHGLRMFSSFYHQCAALSASYFYFVVLAPPAVGCV